MSPNRPKSESGENCRTSFWYTQQRGVHRIHNTISSFYMYRYLFILSYITTTFYCACVRLDSRLSTYLVFRLYLRPVHPNKHNNQRNKRSPVVYNN